MCLGLVTPEFLLLVESKSKEKVGLSMTVSMDEIKCKYNSYLTSVVDIVTNRVKIYLNRIKYPLS